MSDEICEVPRWQRIKATLNNLDFDSFSEGIKANPDAIVLDVRRPDEMDLKLFERGENLNYLSENLADDIEALDSNKTYYVYCRTGRRSIRICAIMKNAGFQNVFNLDGGLILLEK